MEEGGGDGSVLQDGSSSDMGEDKSSSLFFQGSIADAIVGAKTGQKILVVFVAGKDEESVNLECTTLQQSQVVSDLQQQCLVLRLAEGSTDAVHFSAIYPVRLVPTIMFLGLNGSLLHQLGMGSVDPCLSWLESLHLLIAFALCVGCLQLTALATPSSQPGQSSESIQPVSSDRQLPISQDVEQATASRNISNQVEDKLMEDSSATDVSSTQDLASVSTACPSNSVPESVPLTSKPDNVDHAQSQAKAEVRRATKKKSSSSSEPPLEKPVRIRTGPFLLQIRLENGETVQGTFESSQYLRDVKEFVDVQRTDGRSSYNLAIPFPRKVFSDGDLERTLLELELGPRSTLIVVTSILVSEDSLHRRASVNQGSASTLPSGAPAPGGSLFGRLLSFLNPFAYFGGGPPAELQGIPSGPSWQHIPASSQPQPSFATPYNAPANQSGETTGSGSLSQRKAWGVHGNVHTLRQDDDEVSPKGNRYWNGNSTQFGGDDDSKED
ncbi:unnamed protein product [Sphagnum compactum]